jgi:hypothetical protein
VLVPCKYFVVSLIFASEAEAYPKCELLPLTANVRLALKNLRGTDTLAYLSVSSTLIKRPNKLECLSPASHGSLGPVP